MPTLLLYFIFSQDYHRKLFKKFERISLDNRSAVKTLNQSKVVLTIR